MWKRKKRKKRKKKRRTAVHPPAAAATEISYYEIHVSVTGHLSTYFMT